MIQEAIISDLQTRGFKLISVHDGKDLLSDDPTRKLVRQVLGAIAEYEKAMTVLKLRTARDRKRIKNGKCEGRKAYSEIAPDIIRQIKRLRRKPKGQKPMPFNQIADKLKKTGFVTASGKPFTGNNVSTILHRLKKKGG
jgi:DNA invertase Pin-like site-specific DNA recombinase